jgi:hypothetical protein
MSSKAMFFAPLSLVLCAVPAGAADYLTNAQMDAVTAGQLLGIDCSVCTLSSAASASMNGVTTSSSSTTPGISGGNNSGGGSTGNGGSGGNGGGSTSGGTTGGGSTGPSGPGVGSVVQVPANLAAILTVATTIKPQ